MNLRISREHIASVVTSAAMEYCKHSEAEEIDNSQTYCAEACRRWDVEMMTKNRMSYRENLQPVSSASGWFNWHFNPYNVGGVTCISTPRALNRHHHLSLDIP